MPVELSCIYIINILKGSRCPNRLIALNAEAIFLQNILYMTFLIHILVDVHSKRFGRWHLFHWMVIYIEGISGNVDIKDVKFLKFNYRPSWSQKGKLGKLRRFEVIHIIK